MEKAIHLFELIESDAQSKEHNMNHGVHAVQHEVEHRILHAQHDGDKGDINRKVALLISVLALFLAISETLGKSAQTAALNSQVEASNLWNFFQTKSIRRTFTILATERSKLSLLGLTDPAQKEAVQKQIDEWTKTAERYRSEPEAAGGKGEGAVELSRRAVVEQRRRDEYLAKYHLYEFGSAAFQIGIVIGSATVMTGIEALSFLASALGFAGLACIVFGLMAPYPMHLH